jgi:UDP-glucose 4-epimerase
MENDMPEPVLVTGGAGFIGSHLVERLLNEGRHVYVVDDLSTGRLDNLRGVRSNPRLHIVVDSILNYPMLGDVIANVREVVHLAAVVGVKRVLEQPVTTITTNVRGTEILLDLCNRHRTKLFVASTSEIYGKGGEHLDEDHDRVMGSVRNWRWAYACTKEMDEFLAIAYHAEHGLPVIIGRLFNIVGPRQTGQYGMVLPTFVRQALAGEEVTVYGDGQQRRCFCHVDDTVDAITRLMSSDVAIGDIFNIGVEQEITIEDLAKKVIARTGSKSKLKLIPYETAYGGGFEDMDRRQPDIRKITRVTGWKPTRSLDDIVDQTIAFHRGAAQ